MNDNGETSMKVNANKAFVLVCGTAAMILIAGTTFLTISRPANATPTFATQTGKACGQCHQSATGGGKLTPFGEAFKANGNKLP
jgi:hypothetical protein